MRRYTVMTMYLSVLVACSQDVSEESGSRWQLKDNTPLPAVVLPPDGDFDGDGLSNAEEQTLGLDPTNPSSFGDGVVDSERLVVSCDELDERAQALTRIDLGLRRALFPSELTLDWSARGERHDVHSLSSAAQTFASALVVHHAGQEVEPIELTNSFNVETSTSGHTTTWTFVSYHPEPITLEHARATILEEMLDEPYTDEIDDHDSPRYQSIEAKVLRTQIDDVTVTMLAVFPRGTGFLDGTYELVEQSLSPQNIVQSTILDEELCHPFNVSVEVSGVDLYLVLDQSGSMSSYNKVLVQFAAEFSRELAYNGIDYRFGVTNMSLEFEGRLREGVGWHTDYNTLVNEIDEYVINCTGTEPLCSGYDEYGLYVAQRGIESMKHLSASVSRRIRPSAKLVTVFMSDEDANSLKDRRRPGDVDYSERNTLLAEYGAFFAAHTTAYALYLDEEQCDSIVSGGVSYATIASITGGRLDSLCNPDLTSFFDQLVVDLTPREQLYELPFIPVPSSIRVTVVNAEGAHVDVPRSIVDGYDYDPERNAIAFFGSYGPKSSSGYNCTPTDRSACLPQEQCTGGTCVRTRGFEVVIQAQARP